MANLGGRGAGLHAKRLLDVVLAGCGLIAATPLMLVVALAIRITMGSPVLYRQQRPGLAGKPFTMLKFRSMLPPDEGDPEPSAGGDFDRTRRRVTPVGYWLRRTSMDELPELWNVLLGDMSLVGPRPLLMEYLPHYTAEQMRRHEMRPGVTGLAQVRGRHSLDWEDRFGFDLWYVDHWSLRLDTRIMIETLRILMRPSGQSDYAADSEPPRFDAIASDAAPNPHRREPSGEPTTDMEGVSR